MAVMHSAAKGDMDRFGVDLVNSDDAAAVVMGTVELALGWEKAINVSSLFSVKLQYCRL